MCRMVGFVAARPEPAAAWLVAAPQSLRELASTGEQPAGGRGPHGDGWGIAWRCGDGSLEMRKSGADAATDPAFAQVASAVATDLLLAHVRKASRGRASEANAHPFRAGPLVVAHNGTVHEGLDPEPGATDSEALARWLADRWPGGSAEGLRDVLRVAAREFRYSALNLLVSDGRRLFALRRFSPKPDHERYYTLHVCEDADRVLVASEALDARPGWRPLRDGELLAVGGPGRVESLML